MLAAESLPHAAAERFMLTTLLSACRGPAATRDPSAVSFVSGLSRDYDYIPEHILLARSQAGDLRLDVLQLQEELTDVDLNVQVLDWTSRSLRVVSDSPDRLYRFSWFVVAETAADGYAESLVPDRKWQRLRRWNYGDTAELLRLYCRRHREWCLSLLAELSVPAAMSEEVLQLATYFLSLRDPTDTAWRTDGFGLLAAAAGFRCNTDSLNFERCNLLRLLFFLAAVAIGKLQSGSDTHEVPACYRSFLERCT